MQLVPRSRAPLIAIRRASRETARARKQRIWFVVTAKELIDAFDVLVQRRAWKLRGFASHSPSPARAIYRQPAFAPLRLRRVKNTHTHGGFPPQIE